MSQWHYLSFADDDAFRGGCMVEAADIVSATIEAHALGINPGGQVVGVPCPETPPEKWRNRLLTREDLAAFDAEMLDA